MNEWTEHYQKHLDADLDDRVADYRASYRDFDELVEVVRDLSGAALRELLMTAIKRLAEMPEENNE